MSVWPGSLYYEVEHSTSRSNLETLGVHSVRDLRAALSINERLENLCGQRAYTSEFGHFVDALPVASCVRGEDGVLVLRVHLVLFRKLERAGLERVSDMRCASRFGCEGTHQCAALDAARSHGFNNRIHLLQAGSDIGFAGRRQAPWHFPVGMYSVIAPGHTREAVHSPQKTYIDGRGGPERAEHNSSREEKESRVTAATKVRARFPRDVTFLSAGC